MRDLAVLFLHLLATVARLAGPGGARSVVAESVLVKHQLLILNRSRKRSPNLRPSGMWCDGFSRLGTSRNQTPQAVLADRPRSREGQSVES